MASYTGSDKRLQYLFKTTGNLAEDYDPESTYAVGDYVLYKGTLYKCVTAVDSAEEFDEEKWTAVLVTDELGQGGGTGDYTDLTNKPSINGVELSGNKTTADLGIVIPDSTSDLTNDSGFITDTVNSLVNYYLKSETYTQAEVNQLIAAITTLDLQVVQTLPTQDISTTTIYLVPKQTPDTGDVYDEWIYVSNAWEHIGSTQVDLSGYVTTQDLQTALASYVTSTGLTTILTDYAQTSDLAAVATSGAYSDLSGKPTIPSVGNGTLTIQKNGSNVATFTANQSGNSTANISVPTKTSEITNDSGFLTSHQSLAPIKLTNTDIPENEANLAGAATAHMVTAYRNGVLIPYQMDNANDGGMLRVRGKTEDGTIFEMAMWDDPTQTDVIRFSYYPSTSQTTPTYSVSVPKKNGTLAVTSDIPTVNNGTLTIQKNGSNVATFTANQSGNSTANISVPTKTSEITNDSGFLTSHQDISGKVNKSGDTMSGALTFNQATTNAIRYAGTKGTISMIKFKDNTTDANGNGIVIGGGGLTVIGGGESADAMAATMSSGGNERLFLCNDDTIDFYTNCQNGAESATHTRIDANGVFSGTAAQANSVPWSGVTDKPTIPDISGKVNKSGDTMSGALTVNSNISATGTINNLKIVTGGAFDANDVRTLNGWWIANAVITNAPTNNHGALLGVASVGTPFQMFFPDGVLYVYKRWYRSGAWTEWQKLSAGTADSATTATSAGTATHASVADTATTATKNTLYSDFVREDYSTGATSWAANTTTLKAVPATKSGYTCLGVVGYSGMGQYLTFARVGYDASTGNITMYVANRHTAAVSVNITVTLLWVKNR